MAVLLGMLLGALLVFAAALASVWLQQRSATRADRAPNPSRHHRHLTGGSPSSSEAGTAGTRPGLAHHQQSEDR